MPIDMGIGNSYLICHVRRDTGEGHDYCVVKGKRLDKDRGKSLQDTCDDHGAKLSRLYGEIRTAEMIESNEAEARGAMAKTYADEHADPENHGEAT